MIWPLFRFGIRRLLLRTVFAAVVNAGLVIGALLLYDEPTVEALTAARAQAEPLFRALGIGTSASLTLHVVSLTLQLLLPLVGAVYAVSAAALLMAGMVESGEMVHFLAAPKSRTAIVFTQAIALVLGVIVVAALPTAAGVLGSMGVHPGLISVEGLVRAFAGYAALLLSLSLFALMVSCESDTAREARRRSGAWIGLLYFLWVLSRSGELLGFLSYATPFTLYQPERLAVLRPEAWVGAGILVVVGLGCLLYGSIRYARRDLPL